LGCRRRSQPQQLQPPPNGWPIAHRVGGRARRWRLRVGAPLPRRGSPGSPIESYEHSIRSGSGTGASASVLAAGGVQYILNNRSGKKGTYFSISNAPFL